MTIREIETLSGMTRANIRFYESEGLLTPNRMENGYRDYTRSDLDTLHKIRLLRALGLGIDEIRKLSAGETALGEALESRLSAMQTEQRTLVRAEEVARAMLQAHADYATLDTGRYLAALEAGAQTAVQQDVQPKLHAPWRRFFARMIDLLLYDLTWMVILTSAGLCAAGNRGVTLLNDFLALLTMLLLEPLLLQKTGTTLGKWLLGLSVRNLSGAKLRYSEGLDRTARLIWRGFGAGIPIYCWVRLYKSYGTEKKEEPLDWEGESEQMAKPFGWKRGLAAILAAAVMLAAGVCGSLAAIGPRYCGEITIAQFAANFNRSASQLSTQNAGKLTRDGVWTSRDTNTFLLMNVPPFGYETDENGRLQSVCIEADGGASFGARPTGLMQLALYAFAGAQKGHICFNRAIMDVTKRLKAQPQEAFSTVVDGVAVDYQYRAEGNSYRLTMTKTGVDK